MTESPCPCGSGGGYRACCGVLHAGAAAATAEALMRSRYSAFARGDADYLVATLHPSQRRESAAELARHFEGIVWEGLEIFDRERGGADDDTGVVAFSAHYRQGGRAGELRERSRFAREAGRWYYVDGDQLPPPKRGRNDPCWCGSGRKLKRCHG
jgi:SEC-C motif-containing protein